MKPIVTWILLANARDASVLVNRGPGKGLTVLDGVTFRSEEATGPRDRAGVGHSIAGHGVSAVEQTNPQDKIDTEFAHHLAEQMSSALAKHKFDRLIVIAGPHMLGLLRVSFDEALAAVVIGEIDKDLSRQTPDAVASHIEGIIAV